jgi:hypothetical protein
MIELIFIIIVLGILGGMASMSIPDNKQINDINFITSKIKQKQLQALSYDNFDYENGEFFDEETCITTNKDTLNELARNSSKSNPYQLTSTIDEKTICFDSLGRVYEGLNNFQKMPIVLNITYKDRTKKIVIMPYSGAIVVKK